MRALVETWRPNSCPVQIWSWTLKDMLEKLDTIQMESLTVVWAPTLLRPYLEATGFTFRMHHEALRWKFTIGEVAGILLHWQLDFLELKLYIAHRTVIKYQETDTLSSLNTRGERLSHCKIGFPASSYFGNVCCAPSTKEPEQKCFEELKSHFVPVIQKVCMMARITDNEKEAILPSFQFTSAQLNDTD